MKLSKEVKKNIWFIKMYQVFNIVHEKKTQIYG